MKAGLFRVGNFLVSRFLEDGDLHTDYKRTRQFRWKGLDDDLEVAGRKSDEEEEAAEDADEEAWRLQRLEREKWLKGKKKIFVSTKKFLGFFDALKQCCCIGMDGPQLSTYSSKFRTKKITALYRSQGFGSVFI
jgi:hypothetical protein